MTISGSRVVRVREMDRSWECATLASYAIEASICWQASKGTTASLWAPVTLFPPLQGGNVVRILLAPHEYTPGAARRSRVQQSPGSLLEPTASLVAPHPEVRRPNPLTRVSAALSAECQQPCHSRSAPVVPTGGGVPETCPERREQGGWQRDSTLLTGSGCMIGACNVSNRSFPPRISPSTSPFRWPRSTRGDTVGKVRPDSESGNTSATDPSTLKSGSRTNSRTRSRGSIRWQCPRLRRTVEGPLTNAEQVDGARSNPP